jgi:hypothetical protein
VGVPSRFHVFRSRTCFRLYRGRRVHFSCFAFPDSFSAVSGTALRFRGRRVPFSYFARPDSFSAVPRASDPVFMFCAPLLFLAVPRASGLIFKFCAPGLGFSGTEGIVSRFLILRARTCFRRFPRCRVPFSCFASPDSVFGGTEGVKSRFQALRSRNSFRLYRGPRVPFSCFAHPDSFSSVTRASGPVFMFCAPGLIFGGAEGVLTHFHDLCSRTHFRRRVPFSCLVLQDLFSAVPRASGLVFVFCAP